MQTCLITKLIAISSLAFAVLSAPALAEVTVEKSEAGWHVTAKDEPVTQVLKALSKQAGIKLTGTGKLISDPEISGSWNGSLSEVMARILRGADYVMETVTDDDGNQKVTRLVVLSGEIGQAPTAQAVRTARKLSRQPTPTETAQANKDGARVTALLKTNARIVAGLDDTAPPVAEARNSRGSGITRNEDGTLDIDPATQARLAEATRRAQADLQALVNALRQNEEGSGN